MSLSLNNWRGGEERKCFPLEVCAGVKVMVFNHFIHCLAYDNPSIDGSYFNDAADTDIVFLGKDVHRAKYPGAFSPKAKFCDNP